MLKVQKINTLESTYAAIKAAAKNKARSFYCLLEIKVKTLIQTVSVMEDINSQIQYIKLNCAQCQ